MDDSCRFERVGRRRPNPVVAEGLGRRQVEPLLLSTGAAVPRVDRSVSSACHQGRAPRLDGVGADRATDRSSVDVPMIRGPANRCSEDHAAGAVQCSHARRLARSGCRSRSGPGVPRGVIDLLARPRLRGDHRFRADRRRCVARPHARRQGGVGGHGRPRVRALRAAARPAGRARRRSRCGHGAVRRAAAAFHEHTRPADWLEGLVKAYVGDGFATDFYRRSRRTSTSRRVRWCSRSYRIRVTPTSSWTGCGARSSEDPKVAGRLALWARRLVGEALSEAQRVAAERDALAALLVGGIERRGLIWRRSGGCSLGSPRTTPSEWPRSGCRPERGHPRPRISARSHEHRAGRRERTGMRRSRARGRALPATR